MKQDLSEFKDEVRWTLMVSTLCVLRRGTHTTDMKKYHNLLKSLKEFYHVSHDFKISTTVGQTNLFLSFYNSSLEFPNFLFFPQVITSKAKYIEYMNEL